MADELDADTNEKFLSEVDKLVIKLDEIIVAIKGKEGAIDYKIVKDEFDRIRFKINEGLKEVEVLFDQRDKVLTSTVPKEIYERKNLESKLETKLDFLEQKIKELNIELKAQKNKTGKYGDFTNKEQIKTLIEKKFQLLRSKLDGMEIDQKEVEDNRTSIEKLETLMAQQGHSANPELDRELYEEEKEKLREWNEEVARQDQELEEVHDVVKQLKGEVKTAAENIDKVNKTAKKLTKRTDESIVKVDSQNQKLKKLINKLKRGGKICVDVLLILIIIGLAAVLYSVIKGKLKK